jgi:ATP-dependent Clp protease ATP-binding subunit ClpA
MFERYTERARRVIFFARYEASQYGGTTIETEHFLLGLILEHRDLINRFLPDSSSIESIRKEIEGRTTIREKVSTSIDLPLSNECKRILAYAAEEAERLNHRHIGTEHLLLGILHEERSLAAEILHERGLRLSAIREELSQAFVDRQGVAWPSYSDAPPQDAMVPDSTTARLIAQAIWIPVYGAAAVPGQDTLQVKMNVGVWLVTGGPLFVFIRSLDGKVISMGQVEKESNV